MGNLFPSVCRRKQAGEVDCTIAGFYESSVREAERVLIQAQRAVQQVDAVEVGAIGDAVDFAEQLVDFLLHLGAVGGVVIGAVGGLGSQFHHTVEHIMDFCQGAFGCLHQADAVLGVLLSGLQAGDLGPHLLRDGQTGGVVASAVDLVTGRQLLQVLLHGRNVVGVVPVGRHSHNIVLNTHKKISLIHSQANPSACPLGLFAPLAAEHLARLPLPPCAYLSQSACADRLKSRRLSRSWRDGLLGLRSLIQAGRRPSLSRISPRTMGISFGASTATRKDEPIWKTCTTMSSPIVRYSPFFSCIESIFPSPFTMSRGKKPRLLV